MKTAFRLRFILTAFVAAGAVPAAHALSDSPMTMVYESVDDVIASQRNLPNSQERPVPLPAARSGCTLALGKVEDLRANKETLGGSVFMLQTPNAVPLGGQAVVSGDGVKWMNGATASLGKLGLQLVPAGSQAAASGDLGLRLAHAWNAGLNLNSHVVLVASFRTPAGTVVAKRYHGFGTRVNGVNADGEYMHVLNMAMTDALKAYAEDAFAACAGKLPA